MKSILKLCTITKLYPKTALCLCLLPIHTVIIILLYLSGWSCSRWLHWGTGDREQRLPAWRQCYKLSYFMFYGDFITVCHYLRLYLDKQLSRHQNACYDNQLSRYLTAGKCDTRFSNIKNFRYDTIRGNFNRDKNIEN